MTEKSRGHKVRQRAINTSFDRSRSGQLKGNRDRRESRVLNLDLSAAQWGMYGNYEPAGQWIIQVINSDP